jgi:3-hydroxyacyl-[acyl-carrier-protein] dehydratase
MSTATREQIEAVIPHRKPMLLPNFPLVPGVILCECCLQSGAILLAHVTPAEGVVPVATRIDGAKFKRMVRPGETVDIEVTLNDIVSSAYFMTGRVTVNGQLAARLDFACSVAKPEN